MGASMAAPKAGRSIRPPASNTASAISADSDRRYLAAINSFRRLPPREAESLRPLKLSVVVARKGDTTTGMAERMNVSERAHDLFMLLNGLRRSGPLDAGKRYKIVVE